MEAFQKLLKDIGLVRLALVASLFLGVASGLYYMVSRFNQPEMVLLYGELDMADAGRIVSQIESMNIPVSVRGDGTRIYVPSDNLSRLRIELAEMGLPKSGSMGYEIFDQGDQLGVSSFLQNIQQLRALEGELSRTISTLAQVQRARVHLVLPKRKLFSQENELPSASILLSLGSGGRLAAPKVQAIQQLVAAAVPGLSVDRISVVDDRGNLLARGDGGTDFYSTAQLDERKTAYENRLSHMIENLVSKHVGDGRARAEVSVEMDFDRLTENDEIFDPEGQVARSTQTLKNEEESSDKGAESASVENRIPNADETRDGGSSSKSNKSEETTNFEISKKMKTRIKEAGGIKRLSVALLVDATPAAKAGEKKTDFQPMKEEDMEKLKKLVQSAVGYDKERGDQVEIVNMPFADSAFPDLQGEESAPFFGFAKQDILRLVEFLIIGVLGFLGFLFVVKPLMNRLVAPVSPQGQEDPQTTGASPALSSSQTPALEGPAAGKNLATITDTKNQESTSEQDPEMISISQVEGQVKGSTFKNVGNLLENNLDDSVNILRRWMVEKEGEAAL